MTTNDDAGKQRPGDRQPGLFPAAPANNDDRRTADRLADADRIVMPLHAEELAVGIEQVERGGVRVGLRTITEDHPVDLDLAHERIEVQRVAIGRQVDVAPATREEGDTTIIPVVEEVVVVERRLMLVEEIHLRRIRTTEHHREIVSLRRQEVSIDPIDAAPGRSTHSLHATDANGEPAHEP